MSDTYSQGCPIAIALDVIGDRWMLLLLRDLAHAPMRFTDLQAINPKISPNLLSKRLRQLQDAGLAAKRELPPPAAATVYELRPEARDAVLPVLNALGRFGAHLFQAAPAAPADALLEQMRRNGHWVLAKGIGFEAAFRFKLHPHDFGLTVGPTCSSPPASHQSGPRPPSNQTRSPSPGCSTPASTLAKRSDRAGSGSPATGPPPPPSSTGSASDPCCRDHTSTASQFASASGAASDRWVSETIITGTAVTAATLPASL